MADKPRRKISHQSELDLLNLSLLNMHDELSRFKETAKRQIQDILTNILITISQKLTGIGWLQMEMTM
jgi:hypothetical protein